MELNKMFEITRLWDIMDFEDKLDLNLLYKRPRIDYRISEYVFDYINKTILEPNKIMQTGNYEICLSFCFYDKEIYKYFDCTPYDTMDTKYSLDKVKNRTENGIKYKSIWIGCYSTKLTENIKPMEYAEIVYEMVGAFLINEFKKITKEKLDGNKNGMDKNIINGFKFPALFEYQKYLIDDEKGASYSNGETLVKVDIEKEYKNYYKE
jgi:hypothetical protein